MFCKYCGKQISDDCSVCPNCGGILSSNKNPIDEGLTMPNDDSKRKKIIISSAIGVVAIIMFVMVGLQLGRCKAEGCNNKSVPGSDYCYTHKCSVPDCNNCRYSNSNFCITHYHIYDDAKSSGSTYLLKISNVNIASDKYGYTRATGTLTNNSSSTVTFVKIKGSFKNRLGTVVDTDWTYAVDSDGLEPGESCKWELSVKKDSSIKDCDVTVLDYKVK